LDDALVMESPTIANLERLTSAGCAGNLPTPDGDDSSPVVPFLSAACECTPVSPHAASTASNPVDAPARNSVRRLIRMPSVWRIRGSN
jgi:hypothetical protein